MAGQEQYLDQLIETWHSAREKFEEVSQQKRDAQDVLNKAAASLYEGMERFNCEQYRHSQYGLVYLSGKPWARIIDQDKADAFFKEHGIYDDVMQLQPRTGRLNTFLTETYIKNNKPIPSDIGINIQITPTIRRREGKIKPENIKAQEGN